MAIDTHTPTHTHTHTFSRMQPAPETHILLASVMMMKVIEWFVIYSTPVNSVGHFQLKGNPHGPNQSRIYSPFTFNSHQAPLSPLIHTYVHQSVNMQGSLGLGSPPWFCVLKYCSHLYALVHGCNTLKILPSWLLFDHTYSIFAQLLQESSIL